MSGAAQQNTVVMFPTQSGVEGYLVDRGISEEFARAQGVEIDTSPTSARFKERLGFDRWAGNPIADSVDSVLWFPCRDAGGKTVSWVARPLPALGPETKFLNAKGPSVPFITGETYEAKDKPNKPLIVTEGAVKGLALQQAGQLSIAVGGCYLATCKVDDVHSELVPALQGFVWAGRLTYLAFDADWTSNPDVRKAMVRAFLLLYKEGAKVRFLSWALSEAKGIDDYLCFRQRAAEDPRAVLGKLMDSAKEIQELLEPEDLLIVQRELEGAKLKSAQLSQISKIFAGPLKTKASTLEADAIENETDGVSRSFDLKAREPWPEPVNGKKLLSEIAELLRRYVVITEYQATACALWVLVTYVETW